MSSLSSQWRVRLADLLAQAGPDAPTLCEGWTTRDLAAHLVLRERRPDAAAGIVVPALSGYSESVRRSYRDRDYAELVAMFRDGPPLWSMFAVPPVEAAANPLEFYVHAQDVRRASGAGPEPVEPDLARALWVRLRLLTRLLARRAPVPFRLTDGAQQVSVGGGTPQVTVTGGIGELTLFVTGRGEQADVEFDGPDDAVAALRTAKFGL